MKKKTDSQHAFSDGRFLLSSIASVGGVLFWLCLLLLDWPMESNGSSIRRNGRS